MTGSSGSVASVWQDVTAQGADQLRSVGLIVVATLLGALVGWDRESRNKPAGMRTHTLVATASCLVVVSGQALFDGSNGDPTRGLHAVITGIGFIGAGAILRDQRGGIVHGLTTAATLLCAAALGAACGAGLIWLATGSSIIVLGVLKVPARRVSKSPNLHPTQPESESEAAPGLEPGPDDRLEPVHTTGGVGG